MSSSTEPRATGLVPHLHAGRLRLVHAMWIASVAAAAVAVFFGIGHR